jgi:hypothetical protein
MSPDAFLADIEPLTHTARALRVVELGRRAAAGDEGARATIAALAASADVYPRRLALLAAHGSRDATHVLAALSDRSRSVRTLAAKLVPRLCDDAGAARALELVRERRPRARLVAALAKRRRHAAIDAFLEVALGRPGGARDPALVDLLPLASESFVRARLDVLRDAGGPVAWSRFAARQPEAARAELEAGLVAPGPLDFRLRWRVAGVLPDLAERGPDAAIALIRALFAKGEEPTSGFLRAPLARLSRARPAATFDLLRERHEKGGPTRPPGAFGVVSFGPVAHHLGPERLAYLVEHAWSSLADGESKGRRWFLRLDEATRAVVLATWLARGRGAWGGFLLRFVAPDGPQAAARQAAHRRWSTASQNGEGVIAVTAIDALPEDLRVREARRHLEQVKWLESRPELRAAYARFLPFADARAAVAPLLGHPEGDQRRVALEALLAVPRHRPESLADALAVVRARKFEQDPVRGAMLGALVALPLGRYAPAHLDDVGVIVRDALDAADLSHGTAAHAERLVVRLFRVDPAWGSTWLRALLEARGSITATELGWHLTAREVATLAPAIADLATTWATRERAGAVLWLAQSLSRRLGAVPALLDALERLARELPFAGVAVVALGLLRKEARARFERLAPELLAEDASFVLSPDVARLLSEKRQDLLGPFLGDRPTTGRFATGATRWVVDFRAGHARWTATQQRAHAAAWARLVAERDRDVPTIALALQSLARLAYAPPDALVAAASDPRPPVRDLALRALPWLDAGQGVAPLLEALGDDRARVAIYALRKAFGEMARDEVVAHLRAAPTTRVTVAKEVVRLFGELGGDDAFSELLAFDRPAVHRDVRIALLRALFEHLERPEAWPIFERAATDPDWVVAEKLADVPVGRLSPAAESRVEDLLVRVLARPEPEARLALLSRMSYVPLTDARRVLLGECVRRMGSTDPREATVAASVVLTRMGPGDVPAVTARFVELLPARRTLLALLSALEPRLGPYGPAHVKDVARAVLGPLAADAHAVPQALGLAARVFDWRRLGDALIHLASRDLLHVDAMNAAHAAVRTCAHPELLEAHLAPQKDARLRWIALRALENASGVGEGWTAERRARLARYRADASPLVAGAAEFVFPPE